MFGKEPFSDNSFSGGNTLATQLLSVLSTSIATVTYIRVFIVDLLVSVTSAITIPRFIDKFFSLISETVLVVLSDAAFHLIALGVTVTTTVTIIKDAATTLLASVTATPSLFKEMYQLFTVSVTGTVSLLRGLFTTLTATVSNTATLLEAIIYVNLLAVTVTTTASIKKAVNYLLSVSVSGIISLQKGLSLIFTVVCTPIVTLYKGYFPIFGAIADNTFIAVKRIRTIFARSNNG